MDSKLTKTIREIWVNAYLNSNDNVVLGDEFSSKEEAETHTDFPNRIYLKTVHIVVDVVAGGIIINKNK